MDDIVKVRVGALAVSRLYQLKHLLPSSDQPNFSDHDFPMPGYFLNVSGYMELDSSHFLANVTAPFDGLNPAPVYDYQESSNQKQIACDRFTAGNKPSPLFGSVIDQFKLHLNTQVNTSDLVDALVKEIKENGQSYKNAEAITESLEKDYSNVEQGVIFKALCKCFKINIILFGQDGNDIIKCDSNQSESPIYVPEKKLFISLH